MYCWAYGEEKRDRSNSISFRERMQQMNHQNTMDNGTITAISCDNNATDAQFNDKRSSRDSGVCNGIDLTDGSNDSHKRLSNYISNHQISCDINNGHEIARSEKSTQTDVIDTAIEKPCTITTTPPPPPPLPTSNMLVPVGSSTPIQRDSQTKHQTSGVAPSVPPPPPLYPLMKTNSRTILSTASSFCAPDSKSIPCPPPMPCPPPLPQMAGPGKNSKYRELLSILDIFVAHTHTVD